jgi:hypothetical protein
MNERRSPVTVTIALAVLVVFCANVLRGSPPQQDNFGWRPAYTWSPPVLTLAQTYPVIFGGLILASAVVGIVLRKRLGEYAVAVPILAVTILGAVALFI